MQPSVHVPVMPAEVLRFGLPRPEQVWVDGTGGGGGHSRLILEAIGPTGRLLVLDRDPKAIEGLESQFAGSATIRQSSYDQLPEILGQLGWPPVDGIVLDLGLSSDQLADRDRGFSFQSDGELDMRYDPTEGLAVWEWLAQVDEKTLADTIFQYGEERFSRRIAKRIIENRRHSPIRTADQLRELIYGCVPGGRGAGGRRAGSRKGSSGRSATYGRKPSRIDPATRTFQALRIAINEELEILQNALQRLPDCLSPEGRILVISFHSLEDRLTKYAFRGDPRLEIITRKPVIASDEEVASNPRSRSAKLRVARRQV